MSPNNQQMHDLFDGDAYYVDDYSQDYYMDDYHQDFYERLQQTDTLGPGVILSITIIAITVIYQILVILDFDLLPLPQLAWNALVYVTPSSLLDLLDHYRNPPPPPPSNPNMRAFPRTHAEKSEIMRRVLGLDTPGGIMETVANASRRRLSSIPMIGGGGGGSPAGLGNWDSSCYQNSILQALASLDSLPEFLERMQTSVSAPKAGSRSKPMEMTKALQELIATLKDPSNNGKTKWTPAILKNMNSWQQQDAQEYYTKILDAIDKELGIVAEMETVTGLEEAINGSDKKGSRSPTIPQNPLNCATTTRVVCTKCGYSDGLKICPSTALMLIMGDGQNGRHSELPELLGNSAELEFVESVSCERCTLLKSERLLLTLLKRHENDPEDSQPRKNTLKRLRAVREALGADDFSKNTLEQKCKIPEANWVRVTKTKQDLVARPSKALAFHVNRSILDEYGQQVKKTSAIHFPKVLNLGAYCLGSAGVVENSHDEEWPLAPLKSMIAGSRQRPRMSGPLYDLRAVITHQGMHGNGHYICYRKQRISDVKVDENEKIIDQWWRFSDDHVSKVSEEDVLAQGGAYMLFYEQIEPAVYINSTPTDNPAVGDMTTNLDISTSEPILVANKSPPDADDTDLSLTASLSKPNLEDHPKAQEDVAVTTIEVDIEGVSDAPQQVEEYSPKNTTFVSQPYIDKTETRGNNRESHGNLVMV